jgi:beta-phosphoglucomutase-like phosphatase (HAD superfamily)
VTEPATVAASGPRPHAAAVFDFDGTLVDTIPLHYEAYRRTFAEQGLELDEDHFLRCLGGVARETIPLMLAGRPCTASVAELHARKKALLDDLIGTEPITTLGAAELVPVLAPHMPLAIASSGSRPGILAILDRLGWAGTFDVIVTGDDVTAGKPAPDPFLAAAHALGVDPTRCLAFEDSDPGVASARAAGMAVIDVRRFVAASSTVR